MKMREIIGSIKKGEGEDVEFKRGFTRDIAKDICAFLNTSGGLILVGVDDDGNIVGTPDIEKKLFRQLQDIKPAPKVTVSKNRIDDKTIFTIRVDKSRKLHTYRFITYIRVGENNRPLTLDEIVERASETLLINFDSQTCREAKLGDIRREFIRHYLEKRKDIRRVQIPDMPVSDVMAQIKAVKGKKPTNAGILFFSENPQNYISDSTLRVVRFKDESMLEYTDRRDFEGPLWRILEDVWIYLKEILIKRGRVVDLKTEEEYEYPLVALREALINGMIHRNYYIHSDIRLFLFPNKIEVISPGSFPPGVDVNKPTHITRNPVLAQYMYDMGYIDKYGSGIIKMRELCKEHGIDLEFDITEVETRVIFSKPVHAKLDKTDKEMLNLIRRRGQIKTSTVMAELKLSRDTVVRRLNSLVNLNLVTKTGKGRNTFYQISSV